MGVALSAGTIVLVDLCVLGFLRQKSLIARLAPWTWAGLAVMLLTGMALFLSNETRYIRNPGFLLKIALLAVALAAHFTIHRKGTRGAAVFSIVIWSAVVISSRFIADLDV